MSPTPRTKRATPKSRDDWPIRFLAALADGGHVLLACKAAGIERSTAYRRRQADEEFALAWADAVEKSTEEMEREAYRRAVHGVEEPVFHRGEECGSVRKYSDTLLIFLLKGRRPDVYRDNHRVEHTGQVGVDMSSKSDSELDELLDGLADRMS